MNILLPIPVVPSMFMAGTNLPELLPTEIPWVANATYTAADVTNALQRVDGTSIYTLVREHAGRGIPPSLDPMYWLLYGPTNRQAPFDMYRNTKAVGQSEVLVYEIQVGFFDGVALHEVEAERVKIEVLDAPGGNVVHTSERDFWEQATGLWELLFGDLRRETSLPVHNLPLNPLGVLRITLTSTNPDVKPSVGYISVGNWTSIIGRSKWGGTQYGVQATPKSYTYRKVNADGSVTMQYRGVSSRNISGIVVLEADEAAQALYLLERVLGKPVAIEMSDLAKYAHLSTVGFVEGSVKSENWSMSTISITVEGII